MFTLIKHASLVALALPAMALAEPITVTTHSTGIASVNPSSVYGLWMDYTSEPLDQPYELTLSTTFDWTGPLPAREEWASQVDSQVVVDFRLGAYDYHYAGKDWSDAILYTPYSLGGDGYQHEVWVNPHPEVYGYSFKFSHVLLGPAGSMGPDGALAPGLVEGTAPAGYFNLTAYYSNDEYTFSFPMSADVSTFSVQVTSPVPEPAQFVLLAVGALTLGLRRRFGRAA